MGAQFPDLQHGFNAVDLGHHHIGKNDVGALLARKLDRVFSTVEGDSVEIKALEDLSQTVGDQLLVIHDEYAWPFAVETARALMGLESTGNKLGRTVAEPEP